MYPIECGNKKENKTTKKWEIYDIVYWNSSRFVQYKNIFQSIEKLVNYVMTHSIYGLWMCMESITI